MFFKQLIAILSVALGIFFYGKSQGKKSIEEKENESAAEQIQAKNKIIDDVHNLSDNELDKLQEKFTKK